MHISYSTSHSSSNAQLHPPDAPAVPAAVLLLPVPAAAAAAAVLCGARPIGKHLLGGIPRGGVTDRAGGREPAAAGCVILW